MWPYIIGALAAGLVLKAIRSLGKKQNGQLKKLVEERQDLQERTNKAKREIARLTSIGQNLKKYKKQLQVAAFLGFGSESETVAEHTNEPANEIIGHRVNAWIYTTPSFMEDIPAKIVIAGHANTSVCREVSAALFAAYHRKETIANDDILLTGAGILVNNQVPTTQKEFLEYMEAKSKGKIPSLVELNRQFHNFNEISGLVNVNTFPLAEYNRAIKEISGKIEEAFISGKPVVLGNYSEENGMLLPLPFFRFQDNRLSTLTFSIDVSTFDCAEFVELQRRHQQVLIQEMINDVKGRNRRYKEWLEDDKNTKKRYERMSDTERQTAQITITGVRDYQKGTTRDTVSEKISIQEYLDKHLLYMIEEDERWIKTTESELKKLEQSDKEMGASVNSIFSLLIDSFLRGWPSIFLTSEHERKLYDKWLELKRHAVWKKICEDLLERGILPTNLIHTNIIFRVISRLDNKIEIEPNYFLLTNAFLIAIEPKSNAAWYIHPWESRELLPLLIDDSPVAEKDLQTLTNKLINQGLYFLEQERFDDAKKFIIYALRCDAEPAFLRLCSHWWQNLSKDTSKLYQERVSNNYIKSLLSGLSLPKDSSFEAIEQRKTNLRYCIETKPELLPDPYLMLSFLEVYLDYLEDEKNAIKPFTDAAKKRLTQVINDFKAGKLMPSVKQGLLTPEEFARLGDPKYCTSGGLREEKERAFEKAFYTGCYFRSQELLKAGLSKITDQQVLGGIEEYEFVKRAIAEYAEGEFRGQPKEKRPLSIFERLRLNLNKNASKYLDRAREIDEEFVENAIREERLQISSSYWKVVGSFSEIIKAEEFVSLHNWIVQLQKLWQKYPQTQNEMETTLKQYKEVTLPLSYEENVTIERLHKVVSGLKKYVKTSESNMYLPMDEINSLGVDLLNFAANLYKKAPINDLMEGNKFRVLIASKSHSAYKDAISLMTESGRPMRLLTREIEGKVIDSTVKSLDDLVEIDFTKQKEQVIVTCKMSNGDSREILHLSGLTEQDFEHIKKHFPKTSWRDRIYPVGDCVGEMLLNTPMHHVPRVQRFANILNDPEVSSLLIHIMAYSNQDLVQDQLLAQLRWAIEGRLRTVKDGYVVGGVHVDIQKIYDNTLESLQI